MVFRMARPTGRNGTVNQVYRRRIPADVRRILEGLPDTYRREGWGADEITITLGTSDARLASAEFARISHEVERRIAALRAGVQALSLKQAVALAGVLYGSFAEAFEDDPGPVEAWHRVLALNRDDRRARAFDKVAGSTGMTARREFPGMENRFDRLVNIFLGSEALIVDEQSRELLINEFNRALDEAATKLLRNAEGDFRPDPNAERFPPWRNERPQPPTVKLSLADLFDRWAAHPEQANTAPRTKARYKGVFAAASRFLRHPDAASIKADDLQAYVEARMADGPGKLTPRAARDVHKAALSSVFAWADGKKLVAGNPAAGVRIKVTKEKRLRAKEASDQETRQLVAAALAVPRSAAAGGLEAAKRWCPLIALYTGCRIGEACQLRRQDVLMADDLPMIRITPEAGNVKSGEPRDVPIHPRLVELGFLEFVETAPGGAPLFFDRARRRNMKAATPQAELVAADLATWARSNGLGDPLLLRPLHALRHRFMSLARSAKIEDQYVVALTGHEPGNVNRRYGSYPASVLHREIRRLQPCDVEASPP